MPGYPSVVASLWLAATPSIPMTRTAVWTSATSPELLTVTVIAFLPLEWSGARTAHVSYQQRRDPGLLKTRTITWCPGEVVAGTTAVLKACTPQVPGEFKLQTMFMLVFRLCAFNRGGTEAPRSFRVNPAAPPSAKAEQRCHQCRLDTIAL